MLAALGRLLRHDGIACRGERERLVASRALHAGRDAGEDGKGAFDESAIMLAPSESADIVPLSRRSR